MSSEDVLARNADPYSFAPDFLLYTSKLLHMDYQSSGLVEQFQTDTSRALPFFDQMATYSGSEADIEPAVTIPLASTPGLALRRFVLPYYSR